MYSVEVEDEVVLIEYLENSNYRHIILVWYLDNYIEGTSCITTNSFLYNRYKISVEPREIKNKIKENNSNNYGLKNRTETIY
jgi:hypothetical protein